MLNLSRTFLNFLKKFFVPDTLAAPGAYTCFQRAFLPLAVLVRCTFHALGLQAVHHPIQNRPPHALEPLRLAKPLDQRGADRVICANKGTAAPAPSQHIVAETAQRPHLGAIRIRHLAFIRKISLKGASSSAARLLAKVAASAYLCCS